jgi:hypothetical protein
VGDSTRWPFSNDHNLAKKMPGARPPTHQVNLHSDWLSYLSLGLDATDANLLIAAKAFSHPG